MTPAHEHGFRPPPGLSEPSRLQVRLAGIDATLRSLEMRLANLEVVMAARLDGDDLTLAELAMVARARLISTLGKTTSSDKRADVEPLAGGAGIGEADTHNL